MIINPLDIYDAVCYKSYDASRYKSDNSILFLEVSAMDIFKKAFLFVVGAVAIAMEQAEKAIKEQQKKRGQAAHKAEA